MLKLLLIAIILVAATVVIHAVGTSYWMRYLTRYYADADGHFKPRRALPAVIWTAVVLMMLHVVEVVVWASAYRLLPGNDLDSLAESRR